MQAITKIEKFGAAELREIIVQRRQKEQNLLREERLKKQLYNDALDVKVFEEELEASNLRRGGANPSIKYIADFSTSTTTTTILSNNNNNNNSSKNLFSSFVLSPRGEKVPANAIRMTDYKFSTNQEPLRFVANGKYSFFPIHYKTAAAEKIVDLRCKKNHVLKKSSSYWSKCAICQQGNVTWCCSACAYYSCGSCYDADRRAKEVDRDDPKKHELATFLRCNAGCSFTLQIPVAGGANGTNGSYTVSMELRFEKLPPKGKMQSLLRFSLPDLAKARNVHRASVYLNGDGIVVGKPLESGGAYDPTINDLKTKNSSSSSRSNSKANLFKSLSTSKIIKLSNSNSKADLDDKKEINVDIKEEEKITEKKVTEATIATSTTTETNTIESIESTNDKTPKKDKKIDTKNPAIQVRSGIWKIISISVDPEKNQLTTYVNGKICHHSNDLDAADFRLNHKIVVLGGGKQANVRGGDIRRLTIHSSALDAEHIEKVFVYLANENPSIGGRAVKIQTIFRGFKIRKLDLLKKKNGSGDKKVKEKIEKDVKKKSYSSSDDSD
jgi:hypothetical protein